MSENLLRVVPLGGLGEIGQNIMALEFNDEILIIDSGLLFTEGDLPGVDFAIPDITYLMENREKLLAILITHGHEDHIGALPYILPELDLPVYASRLTHGLISVKLKERGLLRNAKLNIIEPHSPFKLGRFTIEFFRVCHSIPDAMGIAIDTPLGLVVHTGDFKIDHTPVDGQPIDLAALAKLTTNNGAFLLLSDSTYAEVDGYTESEQVVGEALDRAISDASGRVMVATFASLISRIQQVINAAVSHDRKIAVIGRSMVNNVNMALKMGYLKAPENTLVSLKEASRLPQENVIIVATGSQGEPSSALVRIANGEHQEIEIVPGDTVVISASPIPGNETVVARTIDNLLRQGANVLYNRIALVHVHGHAAKEELKIMLNIVRPKFFVPVHGEYRHLVSHASIAESMGLSKDNIFILEDGDVLELSPDNGAIVDQVTAGPIYVDGHKLWHTDSSVFKERRRLARNGVVTILVTLDSQTGDVLKTPKVVSSGFAELEGSGEFFEKTSNMVLSILDQETNTVLELDVLRAKMTEMISDFLFKESRRRPTVLVIIEEV